MFTSNACDDDILTAAGCKPEPARQFLSDVLVAADIMLSAGFG
jgi:hypothetical protein